MNWMKTTKSATRHTAAPPALPAEPPVHLPPPRRNAGEDRAVVRPRAGALDVDAPYRGHGEDHQAAEGHEAQPRAAQRGGRLRGQRLHVAEAALGELVDLLD